MIPLLKISRFLIPLLCGYLSFLFIKREIVDANRIEEGLPLILAIFITVILVNLFINIWLTSALRYYKKKNKHPQHM